MGEKEFPTKTYEALKILSNKINKNLAMINTINMPIVYNTFLKQKEEHVINTVSDTFDQYTYEINRLIEIMNSYKITETINNLYGFDEFKTMDFDGYSQKDIPNLKKRIKYCKNPMERKSLQTKLNNIYKETKKRKQKEKNV